MVKMILAISDNDVIGYHEPVNGSSLPWRMREDMRRFRAYTTGHTVVMGRKTSDTFPKPLPNRRNIILTRNRNYKREGFEVALTVNEILLNAEKTGEDIWIIGGAEVYSLFMYYVQEIYLTRVHTEIEESENTVTFSALHSNSDYNNPEGFVLKQDPEYVSADAENSCPATYYVFERVSKITK